MVITGAGPGIMEAGIEGAGADRAFGVNIVLPFEPSAAPVIVGDAKLINYRYFFTRKLTFMKESSAFAVLPGGFGTMDEAFELLTLMQTGRSPVAPVVLLESEGSTYWKQWQRFVEDELASRGLISATDFAFTRICTTVEAAVEEIMPLLLDLPLVPLRRPPHGAAPRPRGRATPSSPPSTATSPTSSSAAASSAPTRRSPRSTTTTWSTSPASSFAFDKTSYARLRQLIDQLNAGG